MRMLLSIIILALTLIAPVKRLDVARLQPVEAVAVYVENGQVVLETDGENKGVGKTALEALEDMKAKALSVIYLDTAQYLLVEEGAEDYAQELRPVLNDSVKVGQYLESEVKEQAKFYEIHGNLPKLKSWKQPN